jgi:hypothetical protein
METVRELTESDLAGIAGGEDYYIGPNPIQDTIDQIGQNISDNAAAWDGRVPIDHSALDRNG